MSRKSLFKVVLAATVALAPATRVAADGGDIVGGIIGGMIGGAIANEARKNTRTRTVYKTYRPSPVRAQTREVQTALNYFGYPAGVADGVMGRNTRNAISAYQSFMNFPVTGQLTEYQRSILVGAYMRGSSGAPDAMQLISTDPLGSKALLRAQRDMMNGGSGMAAAKPKTGYAGLPIEVSEAVDEIAESSDPSAEQLLQRSGFIQLADLNGDGSTDYILDTAYSGSGFWCGAAQCRTMVFVSTPQGYSRNDMLAASPTPAMFSCTGANCVVSTTPEPVMASTPTPEPEAQPQSTPGTTMASGALPLLPTPGAGSSRSSLSSHCSKVSLLTNANGGFTTLASMNDPDLVLNEQFCLARAFAMDAAEQMGAGLQGVTEVQVEQMCGQYGPVLQPYVSSTVLKNRDEVIRDLGAFVLSSGMDASQLSGTAKICLGTGYRTDNMNVAIGSALLLTALGEAPYGELVGHHLSMGFGTPKRADMATDWYLATLEALEGGAAPVFAPGQFDRTELMQTAVFQRAGTDETSARSIEAGASLPTFAIGE